MSKTCEHVGKEHPMYFQCLDCEDTADDCNCNYSGGVFCEKCQAIVWIECDEVVTAWNRANPDKDMNLEKMVIEGHITSYKSDGWRKPH